MLDVRLSHVFVEHMQQDVRARLTGDRKGRWVASVGLELIDKQRSAVVSEWFYLIVGTQAYFDKPFKKGPKYDARYCIVRNELDVAVIASEAASRLAKVHAASWEQFYAAMELHFLHED